jgi:hypothetical protein
MARYLIMWELDPAKIPQNPKERAQLWSPMVQMVRDGMKGGMTKDWGSFLGEMRGYSVAEGTEVELGKMLQQYVPFVRFTTHPILTLDDNAKMIEDMAK